VIISILHNLPFSGPGDFYKQRGLGRLAFLLLCFWPISGQIALGQNAAVNTTATATASPARFDIRAFQVKGGKHLLPNLDVETAVYPFLGPYRTADDVEQARSALEKAYRDKGFQTVAVQIPPQKVAGGVIVLQVVPNEVGRLRVHGSRYFSIEEIKREAPSLQEGTAPNFSQVTRDLTVLNQSPDRVVTPTLRAGIVPGTVDVDLNVKDTLPIHGSLELNNRYSPFTSPLRVNGAVSYDNLWQLGHSIGFSFQLSPEELNQVQVFSGYYSARIPEIDWLTLLLQGTNQDSNVSTLGGIGVAGKGQTAGIRAIIALPPQKDFYHSVSLGLDYKHFEQGLNLAGQLTDTPVTYYPFSAAYSGTWAAKGYSTVANASVTMDFRGIGSSEREFDNNRHDADASFIYVRGDLSHTRDLPEGFQAFGKVQGQAADKPLVNTEQFSGGGLGTVRGYLESEELGDNAFLGSAELRSPNLGGLINKAINEWRVYGFTEGGILAIDDPLPEQQTRFTLASVGVGTRIKLLDHLNGSLDAGLPLAKGPNTEAYQWLLTFRVWAEF
jgi:hemolysin activation/secretion protein